MSRLKVLAVVLLFFPLVACVSTSPGIYKNINVSRQGPGADATWELDKLRSSGTLKLTGIHVDRHSNPGSTNAVIQLFASGHHYSPLLNLYLSDKGCTGRYAIQMDYRVNKVDYYSHYFTSYLNWGDSLDITIHWSGKEVAVAVGNELPFKMAVDREVSALEAGVRSGDIQIDSVDYEVD